MIQTTNSSELYTKAKKLIPGGVNSPVRAFKQVGRTPIYFDSAKGSSFVDSDGNKFVDYCQSWGPLILGHSYPQVVEAVQKAATAGLSYGACHKREVEFAETLLHPFPGFDRVRLVNSGTEAVMTALRIARGFTGRDLVIKFEGGYHGHFDGMLVKAGSGLATQAIASSNGIPDSIAKTTIVLPFDDEDALESVFSEIGNQIAAVIIEPLPANNGLLVQNKNFLRSIRNLTTKHKSILIFDEVISGFRLHFGAYWQLLGIKPDLFTLGKIIGGGMPVGAIVGNSRVMDNLSPTGDIYQAGTLSGNPISLSAGLVTLKVLQSEAPYNKLEQLGQTLVLTLQECNHRCARAQQLGSLVWLYFAEGEFPRRADKISKTAMKKFTKIYWPLLEKGFYLPPSSYEILFISAAHTFGEVEDLAKSIGRELDKIE